MSELFGIPEKFGEHLNSKPDGYGVLEDGNEIAVLKVACSEPEKWWFLRELKGRAGLVREEVPNYGRILSDMTHRGFFHVGNGRSTSGFKVTQIGIATLAKYVGQ